MINLTCYSVFSAYEEIILSICSSSFNCWRFLLQQPKKSHEARTQKVQLSNVVIK